LVRGVQCPLDAPRPETTAHWDLVAALSISSLYLTTNQTYRGHCQLIFDARHAATPDQLSRDEWTAWCADLFTAQAAIMQTVRPDHVNIESLGNVVPHLHWHIVPRYRHDPRWGAPIWLTRVEDMAETALPGDQRRRLIADLRAALSASGPAAQVRTAP
jgi:diadenosine tetraphosphate (Ap4A) HIT family hydrolase